MKLKTIAFLFVFIIILFSNPVKGQHTKFSKTKNGLYYKFHIRNKMAIKAQLGDILIAELTIRTTDSIIFTNKGKPQKIFRVDTSNYKGDLNEGLRLMGKGEKATFIILTDSLKKIMHLPFNQKNKILYYDIKIKDIITKAEIEKEKRIIDGLIVPINDIKLEIMNFQTGWLSFLHGVGHTSPTTLEVQETVTSFVRNADSENRNN